MSTKPDFASTDSADMPTNNSLLIGKVVAISNQGNPMISYNGDTQSNPIEALTTVVINEASIGKDVAISFAQNQNSVPIVMGVIRRILDDVLAQPTETDTKTINTPDTKDNEPLSGEHGKPEVIVDGNKLELSAAEQITLRCGKSSITLNKDGKILIKGDHMLNRTSGSYKIKSGSIQLN